jgi:hypothetical protein
MTRNACTCGNDISPSRPVDDGSDGTFDVDESWVLVEEPAHAMKATPANRAPHEGSTGRVSPAICLETPETSTSLRPEYQSISRADENITRRLFASRNLRDAERLRFRECCKLVQHKLQRFTSSAEDHVVGSQHFGALRQQLATDVSILEAQRQDLEQAEKETQRLEQAWSIRLAHHMEASGRIGPDCMSTGLCPKEPPIIESYMQRAGDASIAAERLAELDYEISTRPISPCGIRGVELVSDAKRRALLNAELRSAIQDAEALKAACVERGLDPERSRYR